MGAGASFPIVGPQFPSLEKITEGGENVKISYAASAMQGHRGTMADAHSVVPDLDDLTSFFGVYDGHGGASVALYCAKQFHMELCNHQDYQHNVPAAIQSVFFRMDELLLLSDEWKESLRAGSKSLMQALKSGFCAPNMINLRGLDGLQGPVYVGTGCVFNKMALYDYEPPVKKKKEEEARLLFTLWRKEKIHQNLKRRAQTRRGHTNTHIVLCQYLTLKT